MRLFIFVLLTFFVIKVSISSDDSIPKKVNEVCATCHGVSGNKSITPDIPYIGGQPSDYLSKVLIQYKSGARNHAIMTAMATMLTDEEISDLAKYFSKQEAIVFVKK